jgi:hypothetical protein
MTKSAAFFYDVAYEENLINNLLENGLKAIKEKQFDDAIFFLSEAKMMEKWKDTYGRQVYSSLSYAYAMIGNVLKAKNTYDEYEKEFGISAICDEIHQKLAVVRSIINNYEN